MKSSLRKIQTVEDVVRTTPAEVVAVPVADLSVLANGTLLLRINNQPAVSVPPGNTLSIETRTVNGEVSLIAVVEYIQSSDAS